MCRCKSSLDIDIGLRLLALEEALALAVKALSNHHHLGPEGGPVLDTEDPIALSLCLPGAVCDMLTGKDPDPEKY